MDILLAEKRHEIGLEGSIAGKPEAAAAR